MTPYQLELVENIKRAAREGRKLATKGMGRPGSFGANSAGMLGYFIYILEQAGLVPGESIGFGLAQEKREGQPYVEDPDYVARYNHEAVALACRITDENNCKPLKAAEFPKFLAREINKALADVKPSPSWQNFYSKGADNKRKRANALRKYARLRGKGGRLTKEERDIADYLWGGNQNLKRLMRTPSVLDRTPKPLRKLVQQKLKGTKKPIRKSKKKPARKGK